MSNETHTQTAKRQRDERLAAENARVAADLKRQADELAAAQEASRVSALAQWQAKQDAEAEAAGMRDKALQAVTATMDTPAQAHQQVLKAEPATADATDRENPATTSPVGGPMGVGQAAAAAPSSGFRMPVLRADFRGLQMDWQPIETAPKDGTVVLLAGCRKPVAAAWLEDEIDYWHVDDNKRGPFALRGPGPTHWMPFPAPPESA
jgi:hypothetical protein